MPDWVGGVIIFGAVPVCIVVARDRTGQTADFVTGNGPVTKRQLHRDLAPVLDRDVLLVTDGNAVYRYFALVS